MMPIILVIPGSDPANRHPPILVQVPPIMGMEQGLQVVNEIIRQANKEDHDNDDGTCDDGLCVEDSILARLGKAGLSVIGPSNTSMTIPWDVEHVPEPGTAPGR